jgi:hypothetical protein
MRSLAGVARGRYWPVAAGIARGPLLVGYGRVATGFYGCGGSVRFADYFHIELVVEQGH